MKYPLNILNDYIGRGLIVKQEHPTLPLSIYNYSRTCQYDRLWDAVTLDCRGLVLDNEGNVVAKPFPKFFNMEELSDSEIPNESFEVFEKMDGSCIICFYYNDEWIRATRGSFISEQAIMANKLLQKYPIEKLDKNNTYIFEIIY
jgi:RNA ligase